MTCFGSCLRSIRYELTYHWEQRRKFHTDRYGRFVADSLQTRVAVIGSTVIAVVLVSLLALSILREQTTNINVPSCTAISGPQGEDGEPGATGAPGVTGSSGAPGKTGPTGAPGKTGPTGAPGAPGQTGAPGSNGLCTTVTGAPGVNGLNAPTQHGSFYSTFTDQLVERYVGQPMRLSQTEFSDNVVLVDATNSDCASSPYCSSIQFNATGRFDIQFSAQLFKVAGNTYITADIWLAKKSVNESVFSDLPWTATRVFVPNDTDYSVAAWNFLVQADIGDQFQLRWSSPDALWANLRVLSESPSGYTTGTTPPQIPGLILTVTGVSS